MKQKGAPPLLLFRQIIQKLINPILDKLDRIAADLHALQNQLKRMEKRQMALPTEQDLDAALERQSVALQNTADRINQKIDDLKAQIAQGQQIDLSDELTTIQSQIDKMATIAPDNVTPPPPPDGGQVPNEPTDTGEPIENT